MSWQVLIMITQKIRFALFNRKTDNIPIFQMHIVTIKELDEWMTSHCYNDTYAIANRQIFEGYGLATSGKLYVWYFTERGKRENLKYFHTEKEAVTYAFNIISSDKFANRHLIGFIKEKSKEQELLVELEKRKIEYWKDEIPYGGKNDPRTRVFVFGCDLYQVLDLQAKYNQLK